MANDARRLSILIRGTGPARRWHRRLAAALQRDGHAVALEFEHARAAHSAGVDLLLELERFAYRARSAAFERQDAPQEQTHTGSDIVIELRERPLSQGDAIVLAPLFDGMPGESALLAALLGRKAPEITIARWGAEPQAVARGLPVVENRNILAHGFDQVLARVENLLLQCVRRIARGDELRGEPALPARHNAPHSAIFAAKGLAAKIAQRLTQLAVHPEHWSHRVPPARERCNDRARAMAGYELDARSRRFTALLRRPVSVYRQRAHLRVLRGISLCDAQGDHLRFSKSLGGSRQIHVRSWSGRIISLTPSCFAAAPRFT